MHQTTSDPHIFLARYLDLIEPVVVTEMRLSRSIVLATAVSCLSVLALVATFLVLG